ncbi:MAG: hypothetical protein O8C60_06255 [Candidatus Methanoperedens sp.]|nr:hypothetical protein [Candidatus Methanoperedens sp.]
MIIEELIRQLQRYPKNSRVIVQGYEDGYDEITTLREISIRPNPSHEWYNGKYESSDNAASETAVLIFSTDRLREAMNPKEVLME